MLPDNSIFHSKPFSLHDTNKKYQGCPFTQNVDAIEQADTVQKLKFPIEDSFSKCEQIPRKLQICSYLLKKSSMEKFIFYVVGPFCWVLCNMNYDLRNTNGSLHGHANSMKGEGIELYHALLWKFLCHCHQGIK